MLTRIPQHDAQPDMQLDDEPAQQPARRGTTAMEYLMMLSLIVVVALIGIGYFGTSTNAVATANSNALSKVLKK